MEFVLVSGCLLGEAVRYNGADKRCDNNVLQQWIREGRVVSVCRGCPKFCVFKRKSQFTSNYTDRLIY